MDIAGSVKVAGYPDEVLWVNIGRAAENLDAVAPMQFMFFALEIGKIDDNTHRLNIDNVVEFKNEVQH